MEDRRPWLSHPDIAWHGICFPYAFQAGTLISPVLAIITTVDPLVSIGVAHAWLGETISSTPPALAGEVISLAVMAGGIYALARRAPHVMSTQPGPLTASPQPTG